MHHEALADLGHRELAGLGEGEQDQCLVAREGEPAHRSTTASTSASRIWCARMIEVIAAMDGTDPQRCFHSSSARAMGSKARLSGFGTA